MENVSDVVVKRKGCIKTTRGDWIVRRRGKGGEISISTRRPLDREREANRLREQRRRRVANQIFAGLREHGKFRLPKHPDRNDILIALCEEAGYKVAEDGSVSHKNSSWPGEPSDDHTTNLEQASLETNLSLSHEIEVQPETQKEELSLDLTISYKYMCEIVKSSESSSPVSGCTSAAQ